MKVWSLIMLAFLSLVSLAIARVNYEHGNDRMTIIGIVLSLSIAAFWLAVWSGVL